MVDFDYIEIQMMQTMLASKPVEYIADIIEKPVHLVREKINELTGGGTIRKCFDQMQKKKALKKKTDQLNKKTFKEQDRIAKKKASGAIVSELMKKREERNKPKYKTRSVDYSQMISVRVDHKTVIMIRPGQDPLVEKDKFLNKHKDIVVEKQWKQVAKFK